jgi:trehalose-phosphatase
MRQFPPAWSTSAEAACLERRLRSTPQSLLMLDYDGTLAPFQVDRFQAVPYAGVEDRLARLSQLEQVRLILVSGRSARELRNILVPEIKAEIWGSHGRERLSDDGTYKLFALNSTQKEAMNKVIQKMSGLGLGQTLEVKPTSIAVHWRSVDLANQERIRSSIQSIFSELDGKDGLHLLPFDGGLELRSMERTKGTVVSQILSETPTEVPTAYLGDDLTDEDAFAVLGNRGYSILVRSEVRDSQARFWIRPPAELLMFLDEWIAGTSL